MAQVTAPAPPKAAPQRPPLALIGAVVGEGDAIAIFLDQTSQKVIRLRQGESLAGWELSAVQPREVMLKQAERTEILALPQPDDRRRSPAATVASEVENASGLPVPAAGGPFFARSCPAPPRKTVSRTVFEAGCAGALAAATFAGSSPTGRRPAAAASRSGRSRSEA